MPQKVRLYVILCNIGALCIQIQMRSLMLWLSYVQKKLLLK